jgi:hypothetical protein
LQAEVERVVGLIERLAGLLNKIECDAVAQKERLLPQLDATIRCVRMLRAYGGDRT